jgi:hypothetical protein
VNPAGLLAFAGDIRRVCPSNGTPFVSGTVALMLDANPNLTLAQVRDILRTTAQDWGPAGQDVDYGWGRLDGYAAVKRAGNFSNGTAPTVPAHVTYSGRISTAGAKAEHYFTVTDTAYPVSVTLIMPGWNSSNDPDFDLYVFNPDGSELGRGASTARQEQVTKRVIQTGQYKVEVRGYAGTGDYVVDISAGTSGSSDLPPTVTVDQPAEGATLSGSTTVKVRAADDVSVSKVELAVDNGAYTDITAGFDGTSYNYTWDTATVANGAHALKARATDSAGQKTDATRNVTVSNQTPNPGQQQHLVLPGRVTAGARDATVQFTVNETGYVDLMLDWQGTADLDFYVYAPDGSYVGRAFTISNPEKFRIDTIRFGTGTYRVRVNLYAGPDSDFFLNAYGFKQETAAGAVSPSARDSTQSRQVEYTGRSRFSVSWPGSSDIDFYVYDPAGKERGRAFTLSNPETLDVVLDTTGTWSVRVNLYAGSGGAYTLTWFVPEAILS